MKILFSIKAFLNYLYNNLIDLIWVKKIRFEDGTEMSSLPVGANIYDIKKLSQAIIDKGWTYLCNSTKQMLPKAKIPTVYEDIYNKYSKVDKALSTFQNILINKSDLYRRFIYNPTTNKYYYLTSGSNGFRIYSYDNPQLTNEQLVYENTDSIYGSSMAIGENIIVVNCGRFTENNTRKQRFAIFDKNLNFIKFLISDRTYTTTGENFISCFYRKGLFFFVYNMGAGDNHEICAIHYIKDNVNVNTANYWQTPFGETFQNSNVFLADFCFFTDLIDDKYVYILTKSRSNNRDIYRFVIENDSFTVEKLGKYPSNSIGNLVYFKNKFYLFHEYSGSGSVYESSDCSSFTFLGSAPANVKFTLSFGDYCIVFTTTTAYITYDMQNFEIYEDNIGISYNKILNYIKEPTYFYILGSSNSYTNFLGSTLIPKVYTENYTINGTTVSIQYYKFEDWKICISDGGTNDTNLDTVYNGLGYENYWLLDINNEQLCLPRISNLYTQMYVGDDYEDITVPTGTWCAVALKNELGAGGGVTSGNVITAYAIDNFINATKGTVYLTDRPTVINFGSSVTQASKYWNLQVSTDNVNWKTISGYKVMAGDPDSTSVYSVVIGANVYWKVESDVSSENLIIRYCPVDSTATDLSMYKLKSQEIVINDTSITIDMILANKNYVFSSNAITDITFTACETSFEETTIEFTTGATAPTLTDNTGIVWVDGSAPTLQANKSYLIVIFNNKGFVKEY